MPEKANKYDRIERWARLVRELGREGAWAQYDRTIEKALHEYMLALGRAQLARDETLVTVQEQYELAIRPKEAN